MSVIKDFDLGGGFPAHNKYKFKFIYYYADISHPNCLMTLMTHDIRDTQCGFSSHVPCSRWLCLNLES